MEGFDKRYLQELAHKYKAGTLSDAERADYDRWYNSRQNETVEWPEGYAHDLDEVRDRMEVSIRARAGLGDQATKRFAMPLFWRVAAAASVLLMLSVGGYFLLHRSPVVQQVAQNHAPDIAPGGNKAVLTLAGGQRIILTGAKNGQLSVQGNTVINKTADGQVVYKPGAHTNSEIAYNTMSTPRGGQYHLTLADGTNVWLNASSSITYPTAFNGKDRQVSITGETFFEVKHNAAQPFRVLVNGQTIEDLGTQFNINAYNDEPVVKTTLLQGSVRLKYGTAIAMLRPGQEGMTRPGHDHITIGEADTEQAVSWKNGSFIFNNEDLASIMRKVSRWYDVDIAYMPGANASEDYIGSMTRYTNVSQVLKVLEETGHVKFRIEGRKILVSKK